MSQLCDGRADVFHEFTRTARKDRPCDACHGEIRRGDRYNLEDVLYEGHWSHTVRCARCQLIFEHLVSMCREHGENDEWPDPNLDCGHEYRERWECDPPAWLAALAFWLPGDPLPAIRSCTLISRYDRERVCAQRGPLYGDRRWAGCMRHSGQPQNEHFRETCVVWS